MPKYLVEIILVVNAKDSDEAPKIADYIIDLPIPDKEIENKIETLRYEEIVPSQTRNHGKFWSFASASCIVWSITPERRRNAEIFKTYVEKAVGRSMTRGI